VFFYSIIVAGIFGCCHCWNFWMLVLLGFFLQTMPDVYDNLLLVANVFAC
jgi:hypothetical protein